MPVRPRRVTFFAALGAARPVSAALGAAFLTLVGLGCRGEAPGEAPSPAALKAPTPQASLGPGAATEARGAAASAGSAATRADDGQSVPLGDLSVVITLPPGWNARWKQGSGLLEVSRGNRQFYVERFDPAEEAGFADVSAAVAMVEGFQDDGLRVEKVEHGTLPAGFFVVAATRDGMGREEPHLFVVQEVSGVHLVCRLGPGVGTEDLAAVRRACESLRPTRL